MLIHLNISGSCQCISPVCPSVLNPELEHTSRLSGSQHYSTVAYFCFAVNKNAHRIVLRIQAWLENGCTVNGPIKKLLDHRYDVRICLRMTMGLGTERYAFFLFTSIVQLKYEWQQPNITVLYRKCNPSILALCQFFFLCPYFCGLRSTVLTGKKVSVKPWNV